MIRLLCLLALIASPVASETVVAARTIPALSIISANDVIVSDELIAGTVRDPGHVIGMEARVALFTGRPIRMDDVSFPAVVERNQLITLHYENNGLVISTEGRALGRAGPGDTIRVMNVNSRSTVSALIGLDGEAYVR